ncbi:hypothetical protein [Thermococcus sp.]|uniref:hypothetical protein n=1 Tax=Thermococcus sp. TaxID=35749 RepID=UPI0025FD632B|nr:hypothetical protein [Thermococcus sp.]
MPEIEVVFYIEGLSNDRKALENAMKETAEELRGEEGIEIVYLNVEDVIESEEEGVLKYSGVIETRLKGDFGRIVQLTLRYSPVVVEVIGPRKIELDSEELMKILGEVSLVMGKLMKEFGGLAVYPKLEDVPAPHIGYEREEIEEFILGDRGILYRIVIEVFGENQKAVESTMAKAFSIEGCRVNKLVVQGETEGGRFKGLLAAELVSSLETLVQLTAKYAPVAISVIEPEIIDILPNEAQNTLTDLSSFVNELITRPLQRHFEEKKNTEFKLNR